MNQINEHGWCQGCGAKPEEPECPCEWRTCRLCGSGGCWVGPDGHYHCKHCDHDTDPKAYDWGNAE